MKYSEHLKIELKIEVAGLRDPFRQGPKSGHCAKWTFDTSQYEQNHQKPFENFFDDSLQIQSHFSFLQGTVKDQMGSQIRNPKILYEYDIYAWPLRSYFT